MQLPELAEKGEKVADAAEGSWREDARRWRGGNSAAERARDGKDRRDGHRQMAWPASGHRWG